MLTAKFLRTSCFPPLTLCPGFSKIDPNELISMPPACEHNRTQMIARRDGVDYVECLDCRQIFEAEDLEPVAVDDDDE